MDLKFVGKASGRVEGPEKVTGTARYAADVDLPGMLWGKILRSPVPHARIRSIDVSRARELPGVHCVLTGADHQHYAGRAIKDQPVLCWDKVRFVGDRVAAVAADSADIAEQALGLIEVEYDELPAVFDIESATAEGAPAVHDDPKGYENAFTHPEEPDLPNVCAYMRWQHGEMDAGFAAADHVFEHSFRTPLEHHGYIEPHACVVDVRDGEVHAWASNKSPYMLRLQLAHAFKLDPASVHVHTSYVGGDFGGKGSPMDAPVAYLLSQAAGRPVKLVMKYTEELMAANARHPSIIRLRTGVKADGTLTAMHADCLFNSGAYGAYKPLPNINLHGADQVASCYRVPAIDIHSTVVYTNTLCGGHMRSPGAPQVVFAAEAQFDIIARELGMDPAEFRLRNVLQQGDTGPTGIRWEVVRAEETLRAALEAAGWDQPREPNVGMGIGMYERATVGGDSACKLSVDRDGKLRLRASISDPGQGIFTAMQSFLAEDLGVEPADISLSMSDTDELPFDFGVGGSRTTYALGKTVLDAAAELRQRLTPAAAELLGAEAGAVEWQPGLARAGGQQVSFADVAARAAAEAPVEVMVHNALPLMPDIADTNFTAQVAIVHVDPETGQVTVRKIISAHDVGTIVNPVSHQGQIDGGMMMGLGLGVMSEHRLQDGQPLALHLGDYKIPCMRDIPELETILLERPSGPGPFNCGPIAEAANVPTPAAIANAVAEVLGEPVMELPVTAERVYEMLRRRRAAA